MRIFDGGWASRTSETPSTPSSAGPLRGGDFSGSRGVTSHNTLLHNGATNATWSGRFDPKARLPCRSRAPAAELGGLLATPNFREYLFFKAEVQLLRIYLPRTSVNKAEALSGFAPRHPCISHAILAKKRGSSTPCIISRRMGFLCAFRFAAYAVLHRKEVEPPLHARRTTVPSCTATSRRSLAFPF
jgi:hypothetical protein